MITRYQIRRGQPLSALDARVQAGQREDTRKHTRHCLRPDAEAVRAFLAAPADQIEQAFATFADNYRTLLAKRLASDPTPFDALAERARSGDVFLGCNCPTAANPRVDRCHTWLALEFLAQHYEDLDVQLPAP